MDHNAIRIQLPVSISYPGLQALLQQKMVGEFIPRPEAGQQPSPYAQILDVRIGGAPAGAWDLVLQIRLRILRTVLKRDNVDLLVHAALGYDNASQLLFVRKYKVDSRTSSRFFNSGLEMLANNVAYNQIIKRTRFNLRDIINRELGKANGMLEEGLVVKGLILSGAVALLRVEDILAQPDRLSLLVLLEANLEAHVHDILSLMPPTS